MTPLGRNKAKTALLAASVLWLAAMAVWGASVGIALQAIAGLALVIVGYAFLGALSYGPGRLREVAAGGALLLTLAVAWATFTHLLLLVGGIGVTLGALIRARR